MKLRLPILVAFFGWLVVITYLFYDYAEHTDMFFRHLFHFDSFIETFFHILILTSPVGSTITAYLMNERRKLLERTLKSEKMLRLASSEWLTTFDSMPYGVMLIDENSDIMRANKYVATLAGRDIKELVHKGKCCGAVHKLNKPLEGCPLLRSISSNRTEEFIHHNKESNRHFIESATPIFDEDGVPNAYVLVIIDITDIKENEKKLIQSKDAFFNMLKDLDATYKELRDIYNDLVIAFSNVIDAKSHWTKGHSMDVSYYAIAIAKEMGLKEQEIEYLKTAALLHDIGKIGTYDEILDKPSQLSDAEFMMIRMHPVRGDEILRPIKGLDKIRPIIRAHHEKYNGTGYPDSLKGEQIPLLARVLCVADSYDAMISDRPYRLSVGNEFAIEELKRCSGEHFDPEVVDAFLRVLGKHKESAIR
ncbi:MAG: HD domain-containing protein [Thermodesulfovibrionia bacterium]|nr:HD domain-containing protein [Thermodesulfovibrionia bacterium]